MQVECRMQESQQCNSETRMLGSKPVRMNIVELELYAESSTVLYPCRNVILEIEYYAELHESIEALRISELVV